MPSHLLKYLGSYRGWPGFNPHCIFHKALMEREAEILTAHGHAVLDWITQYWSGLRTGRPEFVPDCLPGDMLESLSSDAPQNPDPFDSIMRDLTEKIYPNTLHWMHPHFHGYFPSANSAASLFGDMISGAINAIGFSWISNPAGTELEVCVINWLARLMNLPECFHFTGRNEGGGVIVSSASEATLLALLAARERAIARRPNKDPFFVMSKLVGYASKEAHSSVQRAGLFARCLIRVVSLDKSHGMDVSSLRDMIESDVKAGLIPAFVCATLGTTGVCAIDNLSGIGPLCAARNIWLHVDAAYGGNALICPEYQYLAAGMETVDSLVISPHKWMMVNYDCSIFWVRNQKELTMPFAVEPEYLKHGASGGDMPDFRHFHISCGRRFRSLKLWFVLRMHGVRDLQENIRRQILLGEEFAAFVESDLRMQLMSSSLGVVGFRLKGKNALTESLLLHINSKRCIKMIHTKIAGRYVIRFVASGSRSSSEDVKHAWCMVQSCLETVLESSKNHIPIPVQEQTKEQTKQKEILRTRWRCRSQSKEVLEDSENLLLLTMLDDLDNDD